MPAAKRRKGPNGRKSSYYDDDDDDDDMPRKGRRSQSKVGVSAASLESSPFASYDTHPQLILIGCQLRLEAGEACK